MFVSSRKRGSITVSFVSAVDPSRAQWPDHRANPPADRTLVPCLHPFPAGRSHLLFEKSPLPCSSVEIVHASTSTEHSPSSPSSLHRLHTGQGLLLVRSQ